MRANKNSNITQLLYLHAVLALQCYAGIAVSAAVLASQRLYCCLCWYSLISIFVCGGTEANLPHMVIPSSNDKQILVV